MEAGVERLRRTRRFELSPAGFRRLAIAAALALYGVIITGALVRLTASGLGCESWPGCERRNFFPEENFHGAVEFGNRVFSVIPVALAVATGLAARRVRGLPGWATGVAAGVAIGTVGQAPLGLLTIRSGLHPLLVMSHFLLALIVLAGAVVLALAPWRGDRGAAVPAPLPHIGLALAGVTLALVVSGAFATAAGPHPGDSAEIRRIGTLDEAVALHVRVTAAFGLTLAFALVYAARMRSRYPHVFRAGVALLAVVVAQMSVGELQYRLELPWGLVLVHVALAAAVWATTVAFVTLLWRPPPSARIHAA
ncbi:MAG: COX15/CtaA family protein [Thermoleophilia bacterium]|nr:COX15/CtaA family protein [Thermoleophilia bacterium]